MLSSADTHGNAKYARTYIRDTHTCAHTHTQKKVERLEEEKGKVGKPQKKRGGIRKERMKKRRKEENKRGNRRRKRREKGGERKKEREKRKSERDGFRGVEERRY